MPTFQHSTRSRGYLPHWESPNATYFVTFRLADSLPQQLLDQLHKEQSLQPAAANQVRATKRRALLKRAEQALDTGLGLCHLRNPRIAQIVADTIRHFDGQRYELVAWCVMPNHVHVLLAPLKEDTLQSIAHSWKSYSALKCNKLLKRNGSFWQREYFDHLVRSEGSLRKIIQYIAENPRKAGLRDWPWVEVAATFK